MKAGYFLVEDEVGRVRINPNNKAFQIFTGKGKEYLSGNIKNRPLDLDLHIAVYILESEGLPSALLNRIKQWVKENPVAGSRLTILGDEILSYE